MLVRVNELIEFDKVIMSLYMLDYIDDVHLRSIVHRTLNRGEEFHQLRAAILKVSGGQSVRFSSGVTYTINSAVAGYKIYSITAAGAADTVTFI